jgi:glycosyltransferase involved in cell wall biosynthesis
LSDLVLWFSVVDTPYEVSYNTLSEVIHFNLEQAIVTMRLAYFVSHPIQYQAPLLRLIAAEPDIELEVYFFSNFSVAEYVDPGFGKAIKWDVPLTEGYTHYFLDTWGGKERYSCLKQPVAKNITQILKQGKFDAVWVHGWSWFCSLQAIWLSNRLGIPIFLRGESNGLTEPTTGIKKIIKTIFIKWLFPQIRGFFYVGSLNRKFYQSYGVKEEIFFWMPYTVDNNYFQEKAKQAHESRESLRQSLNLESGRPIILFAAKLIQHKRPQDLLAAYRLLSPNGLKEPSPYLLFVGDGELRDTLEEEAQKTEWNSIRFLGFYNQSKMPEIYDLCDVFVMTSDFEPWGLAINEVMNAGKAVVVSDVVGCVPDLVYHQQNGWVFPVGDIGNLVAGIQWALANSQTAGQKSIEIIQKFSFIEDIIGLKLALSQTLI